MLCLNLNAIHFDGVDNYNLLPLKYDNLNKIGLNLNPEILWYSAAYQSYKQNLVKLGLNLSKFGFQLPSRDKKVYLLNQLQKQPMILILLNDLMYIECNEFNILDLKS